MNKSIIVIEKIENKIFTIRGQSVMLDRDLAELYNVPTFRLNEAVKRNKKRFPERYVFKLNPAEKNELIANCDRFKTLKHSSSNPFAFTEHGIAMLSSVLNSERAVAINIQIIDVFVAMRRYALKAQGDERIATRLGVLEKALLSYMEQNDKRADDIIAALNAMLAAEEKKTPKKIGFAP